MSGIGVGNTFRQIEDKVRSDPSGDTHVHGSDDGELLLGGEVDLHQSSRQRGSEILHQVIVREYGVEVSQQIFQKIRNDTGRDPGQVLRRDDLRLIKVETDRREPMKIGLTGNLLRQKEIFCLSGTQQPGKVERTEGTNRALTAMFGFELTDQQIRWLGGIPDRCRVKLDFTTLVVWDHFDFREGEEGVEIALDTHDDPDIDLAKMTIYRDRHDNLHLHRGVSGVVDKEDRTHNLGCCMLLRQMNVALSLGVKTIHNTSARDDWATGYYVWARCGGNAGLTDDKINYFPISQTEPLDRAKTNLLNGFEDDVGRFREALRDPDKAFDEVVRHHEEKKLPFNPDRTRFVQTIKVLSTKDDLDVQDLMQTREGQAFWRTFGFSIPLTFDVNDPKTRETFQSYTVPNSFLNLR